MAEKARRDDRDAPGEEAWIGWASIPPSIISFNDCRVPAANLLGNAEVDAEYFCRGHGDPCQQFVAGGRHGRRVLRRREPDPRELPEESAGCKFDYRKPLSLTVSHAEATSSPEASEAARLLTLKAVMDGRQQAAQPRRKRPSPRPRLTGGPKRPP